MKYSTETNITLSIFCMLLWLLPSCIKNDFPYPTVKLSITALTVEGQKGSTLISNDDRTVTVELEETVNPCKVTIDSLTVSDGGKASVNAGDVVDLSQPLPITLSLYQEYQWTLVANQQITRIFKVEGQIGETIFYPERREASANVSRKQGLEDIKVLALKLGPAGSTMNGSTEGIPALKWEKLGEYTTAKVRVQFSDFIDEEWSLFVNITDQNVGVSSVDAWTNVAWLHGFGEKGKNNGFEYKKAEDSEWIKVDAKDITTQGETFTARLIHLLPNTAYICRAYSDNEYSAEQSFTTSEIFTLPNLKFEDWHQEGKVIQPWAEGNTSFWDTGNDGTTTMNKNVTQSTDEVWQNAANGSKAAILKSQFVGLGSIGKFAAGNLFVGEFVRVDGTNGILNFGREFSGCPTKLKGHFKYTSTPIKYTNDTFASLMGKPDSCIVWVALGDWNEPVEIRTNPKNPKYFDKNDPKVIAYGEMVCGETISEYKSFSIDLKYNATNRRPKYILIVCSASKYGDYFTGGEGATMWVDDFSLEYDYEE